MMINEELIHQFYRAFQSGDADAMAACYHDEIVFSDPAFDRLQGEDAKNMWRMLVAHSKGELKITYSGVHANAQTGGANWKATYVFAQTGRPVVNHISAHFEFKDGKISRHTDTFDLWKWSRQALGWKGYLLGWSGFMKKQIQKQTNGLLKSYTAKRKA